MDAGTLRKPNIRGGSERAHLDGGYVASGRHLQREKDMGARLNIAFSLCELKQPKFRAQARPKETWNVLCRIVIRQLFPLYP